MNCPRCDSDGMVLETRTRSTDGIKRRRYVCANEHRFSTLESVVDRKPKNGLPLAITAVLPRWLGGRASPRT